MKKILIIEDDINLREEISEILRLEGFDVKETGDGKEGLGCVLSYAPDIILCDIMMPEMDGPEVLFSLRENENSKTIPFVFITALADRNDFRKGMELGAEDYLTKPFTRNELLNTIRIRLGKKEEIEKRTEAELNKLRNNIISHIPHELLTPLNGIFGFGELLRDYTETLSQKDIKSFGNNICSAANRLHSLIKKYLIYIRLESMANLNLKSEPLQNVRATISKITRAAALEHQRPDDLILDAEDSSVFMDEEEFTLVIEELTDNAFKFSKERTPVNVTCKNRISHTEIIIEDNGHGFPADFESRIGAFVQFDREKYEQQGAGLGLVLSRRIVDIYGGSLKIESGSEGAKVIVKLPVLMKK